MFNSKMDAEGLIQVELAGKLRGKPTIQKASIEKPFVIIDAFNGETQIIVQAMFFGSGRASVCLTKSTVGAEIQAVVQTAKNDKAAFTLINEQLTSWLE